VPAERRRRDLPREVPGEVEGVDAVEHPEVVALPPDDLLAAGTDLQGQVPDLEIDVELPELVVELERVEGLVSEVVEPQRLPLPDGLRELEQVETAVRAAVDVLLLQRVGRGVVDAVVDATPEEEEVRRVEERDIVAVVELAALGRLV